MLRKHNKLIMLLVLVTFMFTMVGSAGAASFSDVTGNSAEASAIYRLSGLGVLDGYPDGTFGAEKTITRAEFAKIACVTAGLKSVASGMGGTASPFSDVATDHWANGWINVAAAQGYVKGDPAGTFRPEDQITQAEVVTVLLRLLGYNDNLAGEWPSDYIAKAANLGVLDDVTFAANQAATRGVVAVLASATLDENVVEYAASDNLFNEVTKDLDGDGDKEAYTLLYDKFDEAAKTEDALIMGFTVNTDDEKSIVYYTYNDDFSIMSAQKTAKIADVCAFSGGSILDCVEVMADFVVNDDNEVISITVKDYKKIGPKLSTGLPMNELEIDGNKVSIDGTDYSFISGNIAVEAFEGKNGQTVVDPKTIADATYDTSDAYAVIMNDDDKVVALRAWTFPTPGIVESVSGDRVTYIENAEPAKHIVGTKVIPSNNGLWSGYDNVSDFEDEDIYVQRNGKPATLADIQANDTLSVLKDYRGCDYYLVATGLKMSGKLQSAKYKWVDLNGDAAATPNENFVEKVKVMDMWWKLPYANLGRAYFKSVYSIDNGAEIEGDIYQATLESEYDVWNTDVAMVMSATGKPAGLFFGEAAASSKMYGVITDVTSEMAWSDGTTVRNIKLMKSDEEEYNYPICDDTYIKGNGAPFAVSKKIEDSGSTLGSAAITNYLLGWTGAALTPQLVSVSLKSSGLVDRIEVLDQGDVNLTATTLDDDEELILLGGKWLDGKEVVVFNLNNGGVGPAAAIGDLDETKVVGWSELEDLLGAGAVSAYYANSNNKAEYVVVNAAPMTGGSKYAIYKEKFSDSDDWIQFIGHDAYMLGSVAAGITLTKGDVVKYELSGNEANVTAKSIPYNTTSTVTVKKISGSSIELSGATLGSAGQSSWIIDADTVFLDNSDDDDLKVLTNVSVGDTVYIIAADATTAAAIVVVSAFDGTAPAVASKITAAGTISANGTHSLVFSEPLDAASKAAVGAAVLGAFTVGGASAKAGAWNAAGTTYTVTISGWAAAADNVTLGAIANQAVTDLYGNASAAALDVQLP